MAVKAGVKMVAPMRLGPAIDPVGRLYVKVQKILASLYGAK
jgi:hypothetical protein